MNVIGLLEVEVAEFVFVSIMQWEKAFSRMTLENWPAYTRPLADLDYRFARNTVAGSTFSSKSKRRTASR